MNELIKTAQQALGSLAGHTSIEETVSGAVKLHLVARTGSWQQRRNMAGDVIEALEGAGFELKQDDAGTSDMRGYLSMPNKRIVLTRGA